MLWNMRGGTVIPGMQLVSRAELLYISTGASWTSAPSKQPKPDKLTSFMT